MVDMNLVREMVNNPDMPISVIEMAFSYLSIEDRAAIVDATTKEDLENKEWGKLILDMRQQDVNQLRQNAPDLLSLANKNPPSPPPHTNTVINSAANLR